MKKMLASVLLAAKLIRARAASYGTVEPLGVIAEDAALLGRAFAASKSEREGATRSGLLTEQRSQLCFK